MEENKHVTIYDIAEKLNLATSTISRALKDHHTISDKTIKKVKKAAEDSLESKIYTMVENYKEYIPTPNDRNRLSFCLVKFVNGEGDEPKITLKNAKIGISGISVADLAKKLDDELLKIK